MALGGKARWLRLAIIAVIVGAVGFAAFWIVTTPAGLIVTLPAHTPNLD